ncbi:response regulator transcription factor [Kitasatospora sp. NPDC056446]|uniref:response regulator transcription factor n=1 Tax=Kitasatospora sp. NPDC056446 TaxID=3345819 RepID=UPI0036BB65BF
MTPPPQAAALSAREVEVLEHLVQGLTYGAIARRLRISPHTVETHLRRIRAKTGSANRTQLALLALAPDRSRPAGQGPDPHPACPGGSGGPGGPGGLGSLSGTGGPTVPDPATATTPAEFVTQLRLLKAWAGEPSLRRLERRTGLPRSTLARSLDVRHNRLPPLERVVTIVRACGVPAVVADHWADHWRRIQMLACLPKDARLPDGACRPQDTAGVPAGAPAPG